MRTSQNCKLSEKVDIPQWLKEWQPGLPISIEDFLSSKVVFYPGSGTDGQHVKFFGSRHAAHCFVYIDYGIKKQFIIQELDKVGHPFAGYAHAGRIDLSEQDLTPNGWTHHFDPPKESQLIFVPEQPYAFIEVLERKLDFDETHGPRRLAVLFICSEGVATYDALFCQPNARAPYAVVVQDHGYGGNWTKFGQGGQLEQVAYDINRLPEILLVAENSAGQLHQNPLTFK